MKKILYNSFLILAASSLFTACLKDKGAEDGTYGIPEIGDGANLPKVIEIPSAGASPVTFALNTIPANEEIGALEVNFAAGVPASEDIKVTLVKNMTLVADYNVANGTNYIEMPGNTYTLPAEGLVLTIPKGKNRASLNFKLNKNNFDFSKAYALGYSIASVSPAGYVISQNYKNVIIAIGVKNKYDGLYIVKGFGTHPSLGTWAYQSPCGAGWFTLVTSGPASVDLQPGHPAPTSATALSYFGTVIPRFTIDASNNVSISGAPGNAVVFDPFPTYPARYVDATKTMYVKVGWSGTRIYTDTLTYCGPR